MHGAPSARGTIDIDVNIFVDVSRSRAALEALPDGVAFNTKQVATLEREGQARLWWDHTPVDVFLDTTPFHEAINGTWVLTSSLRPLPPRTVRPS